MRGLCARPLNMAGVRACWMAVRPAAGELRERSGCTDHQPGLGIRHTRRWTYKVEKRVRSHNKVDLSLASRTWLTCGRIVPQCTIIPAPPPKVA